MKERYRNGEGEAKPDFISHAIVIFARLDDNSSAIVVIIIIREDNGVCTVVLAIISDHDKSNNSTQ